MRYLLIDDLKRKLDLETKLSTNKPLRKPDTSKQAFNFYHSLDIRDLETNSFMCKMRGDNITEQELAIKSVNNFSYEYLPDDIDIKNDGLKMILKGRAYPIQEEFSAIYREFKYLCDLESKAMEYLRTLIGEDGDQRRIYISDNNV